MAFYSEDDTLPVTRITSGAIGEPGRRIFILQAQYGSDVVSWVIEKTQAMGLARDIPELLAQVQHEFPELGAPVLAARPNLSLAEPLAPEFRVGAIGLEYDRLHDLVVLTLVDGTEDHLDDPTEAESEEGEEVEWQVFTTRGQALLLAHQTEEVVSAGRPACPMCGEPIDDFGHFCRPASVRVRAEYRH